MITSITIAIPEGYQPENISSLNTNFENESISFVSDAKVEGKTIVLNVTKSYKKIFDLKQDWNKYVEGLKKASDFYEKKLVLKSLK
jgi:hypothetical protein